MSGYYGSSSYDEITKADIGSNPGGRTGCDGCNLPTTLYGLGYSNSPIDLSFIILTAIALVLALVSFGGFPVFKRWSAQVSTGLTRYGVKTILLALASIVLAQILNVASSAVYNAERRVTRSWYLIGWFQQFFTYVGSALLLYAIARFIRGQAAHAGRSIVQIVVFGLLALSAIPNLAAFIAYLAWYINVPYDDYDQYAYSSSFSEYAPDVTDYISYLAFIYYITDLVFWAVYILAATYTTVAFFLNSRAFKIFSVLTTLLAIGLLVLQAILYLVADAMSIWQQTHQRSYSYSSSYDYYSESYYTISQNLYLYRQIVPGIENILLGAACPVFVIAVYFASRHRIATTEKA